MPETALLSLEGLNSFYGKAHILHDLGFSVAQGEVVALLGRNGAGKTTTLKSIMQLLRPASGRVTFDGRDITRQPAHRVCRLGLGYVPEERRIFTDLTIVENLEVGRQPPRDGVPTWTRDALFALFPNLSERRDNRGKALSGGEQQMLTIARTLMGNRRLLLLDEPSEGIAPVIVEQMAETIRAIKTQGLTVLLSEQNLHFARLVADRALIIEGGELRFDGTFAELDANANVRDAYLSVQLGGAQPNHPHPPKAAARLRAPPSPLKGEGLLRAPFVPSPLRGEGGPAAQRWEGE